jgi:peroxiredoxin
MSTAALVARVVLAAIFLVAGAAKLTDSDRSEFLVGFGVPRRLAAAGGIALPIAELVVAGALLPRGSAWWGAWGALGLLAAFIVAIAFNLARGRTPDCHCFGQIHFAPAGKGTLLRNLVLAAMAVFVLARGSGHVGPTATAWAGQLSAAAWAGVGGGLVLVFLLATGGRLLVAMLRSHGELLLRIDALEAQLAEQGFVLAARDPQRALGLTVGTRAPMLEVETLDGERVTLDQLRTAGLPLLLVFSDPGCGPCKALLPRIGDWQRDHSDRVTVALISRGEQEVNRGQTCEHGIPHVLLQEDQEAAHAFEVPGTPGAVLIGPAGNISSQVVMGAEAIEQLVASVLGSPPGSGISEAAEGNGEPEPHGLRISRMP